MLKLYDLFRVGTLPADAAKKARKEAKRELDKLTGNDPTTQAWARQRGTIVLTPLNTRKYVSSVLYVLFVCVMITVLCTAFGSMWLMTPRDMEYSQEVETLADSGVQAGTVTRMSLESVQKTASELGYEQLSDNRYMLRHNNNVITLTVVQNLDMLTQVSLGVYNVKTVDVELLNLLNYHLACFSSVCMTLEEVDTLRNGTVTELNKTVGYLTLTYVFRDDVIDMQVVANIK